METLPSTEDAWDRLLTPDAQTVPELVTVDGALVGGMPWTRACRVGEVCGFDLSALNRLAPAITSPRIDGARLEDALSDEVEVFRFDLRERSHPEERKTIDVTARRDGVVDGVLQWVTIRVVDDIELHSKPPAPTNQVGPQLHVFPESLEVRAGQQLRLNVEHNRTAVMIWPVGAD